MFGIAVLVFAIALGLKFAPRDHSHSPSDGKQSHTETAGQVGLLAAAALFGVDYFSSFFYATGEMLHALHPVGLQAYAWFPVVVVGLVNIIFGGLYIYALGIFNEGGGSYTASMRYLAPMLSLIVAITLLEDYILTVVVSSLSGADQFLSITNNVAAPWYIHFGIGAALASLTCFITIIGRGESAKTVFTLLVVFVVMTVLMFAGLLYVAVTNSVAPAPHMAVPGEHTPTVSEALFHLLAASMKGLVALTGLEAMSNGIQFVRNKDAQVIVWAKRRLPRFETLWAFYSGKVGIGRIVQSSFLFYGGITTGLAAVFAVHFNVFDGTYGRTLIGNLAYIGFSALPQFDGQLLFGAYQILSVILLAAASMTAFQDTQATAWCDVAIGVCKRNAKGTFTRSVAATWIFAIAIMFLVGGNTSHAIPFYGVGVFLPIGIMGLAVRRHLLLRPNHARIHMIGAKAATVAASIAAVVFFSQLFTRWEDGGWVRIFTFVSLFAGAHFILMSRYGQRTPEQITHIVRERARAQGGMADIVEWQALKMQEYRYTLRRSAKRFLYRFGIWRRPDHKPMAAGPYNENFHHNVH
jgi:hypothetical protein